MDNEISELKIDRKIIFYLIGILISVLVASGSGFFVMYGDVASTRAELKNTDKRINKIEKIQSDLLKSSTSIDKSVGLLVQMANVRNALLEEKNRKQSEFNKEMRGFRVEQIKRIPRIKWVDEQMAKGR